MKFFTRGMPPKLALDWLMVITLFFAFSRVAAQSLRDPTLPPSETALAGSGSDGTSLGIEPSTMIIIVRNGHPYLVIGTRLYAQGEKIGNVYIEHISETEIWLREFGVLRKLTPFPGILRHTVNPLAEIPSCASSAPKSSSQATPCVKLRSKALTQ